MQPLRAVVVTAILVAIPRAGFGQNVPSLSLRQALDYAHLHQPSLEAARDRVAVARANADVPRAGFMPRITAGAELLAGTSNNTTASYASLGILDLARIGGTPANAPVSWSPEPSTLAGIALHQQIYDFGRLEAQADAFDELATSAEDRAKIAQLDLELLVEESFYAVLGAREVLDAAEAAVTRSQAHHDLAKARVGAQLRPPIDLTRADADLARYELDRVRATGALATAQAVLAGAIGSPEPRIDAGADDVAVRAAPGSLAEAHAAALHAPELHGAEAELRAQQQITRSIRAELLPDLGVSAEVTGRAGGAAVASNPTPAGGGWIPDVPNWDVLAVLSWPIFDRTITARARASQQIEQVRTAELGVVSNQIAIATQRAYIDLDVARSAVPALQRALDAATANHDQAEARFNGGLGTAVELSDAEALLTDAQIQLAIGKFQLSRAAARLARMLSE
ncbi:MAG: TolC family protein [Kofleriaceae bacterium]